MYSRSSRGSPLRPLLRHSRSRHRRSLRRHGGNGVAAGFHGQFAGWGGSGRRLLRRHGRSVWISRGQLRGGRADEPAGGGCRRTRPESTAGLRDWAPATANLSRFPQPRIRMEPSPAAWYNLRSAPAYPVPGNCPVSNLELPHDQAQSHPQESQPRLSACQQQGPQGEA